MTPQEHFESNYIPEPNSGCFLWTGSVSNNRYGRYGKFPAMLAHRFSWQLYRGEIPKGIYVLHRCDIPCCVNPDHLFLGTQKENMDDCRNKGRKNQTVGEKHANVKLTEAQAIEIKASKEMNTILAKKYGVSPGLVGNIKHGRGWRHLP